MRTRAIGQFSAAATTRCRTYGCCVGVQTTTPFESLMPIVPSAGFLIEF